MSDVLTLSDAVALGRVVGSAQRCARVARVTEHGIVYGTARHLCPAEGSGCHLGSHDDVRDTWLRVTTVAGWEVWWPVRELMAETWDGTFAIDVEPPR